MKAKFSILTLLMIPVFALFSFAPHFASGIKGTVTPAENAGDVWAIVGNDSTKVTPLNGVFLINYLKPGTYKFVAEGRGGYKDYVKEGVVVKDGEVVDLGTIVLPK